MWLSLCFNKIMDVVLEYIYYIILNLCGYCFIVELAEVVCDFDAGNSDELTLRVGSLVTSCMAYKQGWMIGELNGKRGMFPSSFVKIIPENSTLGMCVKDTYLENLLC